MMIQASEEETRIMEKIKKETDPRIKEELIDELAKAHAEEMKKYNGIPFAH